MVNPEALKQAVLKALPYREDPILGIVDSFRSIHGIKDYNNPLRDDIILEATDEEIKAALKKLVKEKLVEYRGTRGRVAAYSRAGKNPAYLCPVCGETVEYEDIDRAYWETTRGFKHKTCSL